MIRGQKGKYFTTIPKILSHNFPGSSDYHNNTGNTERDEVDSIIRMAHSMPKITLIDRAIAPDQLELLAKHVKGNIFLTEMYLDNNQMGDIGMKVFKSILTSCPALFKLDIRGNKLSDDGAELIAAALRGAALKSLCLNENFISDRGARAIAAALPQSCVTQLFLRRNQITADGTKGLAETLPQSHLETLHLGGNLVGDEGAAALAQALSNQATILRNLMLDHNGIGNDGAAAFGKMLAVGSTFYLLLLLVIFDFLRLII